MEETQSEKQLDPQKRREARARLLEKVRQAERLLREAVKVAEANEISFKVKLPDSGDMEYEAGDGWQHSFC